MSACNEPRLPGDHRLAAEDDRPAGGNRLLPGDEVFHPKYGFGTIHSLMRRDRIHPIHETTAPRRSRTALRITMTFTLPRAGQRWCRWVALKAPGCGA